MDATMDTNGSKDIFNKLPNPLIIEILSFMPHPDAIRTSLLSKRWKYLWRHVYSLEYEPYSNEWGLAKFKRFLDLYEAAKFRKFKAEIGFHENVQSLTTSWVNMALDRKVEELILFSRLSPRLPQALLCSKSLVALTLTDFELQLPASIRLSSLKILSLTSIKLTSNLVKDLISNSPVLAYLSFNECSMTDKLEISSESFHFKSLTIRNTGKGVWIYAPHLEFLLLSGQLLQDGCFLSDMSSLVEVYLHFHGVVSSCMSGSALEHSSSDVLKGIFDEIYHVKRLCLCGCSIPVHSVGEMRTMLPQFINLRYLKLDCTFKDVGRLPGTANLISKCPMLETLVITLEKDVSFCAERELWRLLENMFSQLLVHLKSVTVNGFAEYLQEIALAENPMEKVDEIFETYDSLFEFVRILLRCSESLEILALNFGDEVQRQCQNCHGTIITGDANYFFSKLQQRLQTYCDSLTKSVNFFWKQI